MPEGFNINAHVVAAAHLNPPCKQVAQNYTPPHRSNLQEMRKCYKTENKIKIPLIFFPETRCQDAETYVSTHRFPVLYFQSSGRKARPRARLLGHGTGRSRGVPELQWLLSSCLNPEPASSPGGPPLKKEKANKLIKLNLSLRFKGQKKKILFLFVTLWISTNKNMSKVPLGHRRQRADIIPGLGKHINTENKVSDSTSSSMSVQTVSVSIYINPTLFGSLISEPWPQFYTCLIFQ